MENVLRKRCPKTTRQQYELYVNFLLQDAQFSLPKTSPDYDDKYIKSKWEELCLLLNSTERGPKNNISGWKKAMKNWKTCVRAKAKAIQGQSGDSNSRKPLSYLEERLIEVCGLMNIQPEQYLLQNESELQKAARPQSIETTPREKSKMGSAVPTPTNAAQKLAPTTKKAADIYNLQWNNFSKAFSTGFNSLLVDNDLVDVTIAIEGNFVQAHKLVLSVCSEYFRDLFRINPCQHPIVILTDIEYSIFKSVLQFMYTGEVQVAADKLHVFMKIATLLKVKGLNWTSNQSTEVKQNTVPEPAKSAPKPLVTIPESQAGPQKLYLINKNTKRKQESPASSIPFSKLTRLTLRDTFHSAASNIANSPPPLQQKPMMITNTSTNHRPTSNLSGVGSSFNVIIPTGFINMVGSSKHQTQEMKDSDTRNIDDNLEIKDEDVTDIQVKVEHITDDEDDDISVTSASDRRDPLKEEFNQSDEFS